MQRRLAGQDRVDQSDTTDEPRAHHHDDVDDPTEATHHIDHATGAT